MPALPPYRHTLRNTLIENKYQKCLVREVFIGNNLFVVLTSNTTQFMTRVYIATLGTILDSQLS